jgi:uncharacterized damage-inducible protein DinB
MNQRPDSTEYAPFYEGYVNLVPAGNIVMLLKKQIIETDTLLRKVSEDQANFRYAPEKWSLKEIIGHMTDTERIMSYRALRIGRGDSTPLPGFDQDSFVTAAHSQQQSLDSLLDELTSVRQATISLFEHFPNAAWSQIGVASKCNVTTRALSYIIAGHELHHRGIIIERYLNQ